MGARVNAARPKIGAEVIPASRDCHNGAHVRVESCSGAGGLVKLTERASCLLSRACQLEVGGAAILQQHAGLRFQPRDVVVQNVDLPVQLGFVRSAGQ